MVDDEEVRPKGNPMAMVPTVLWAFMLLSMTVVSEVDDWLLKEDADIRQVFLVSVLIAAIFLYVA